MRAWLALKTLRVQFREITVPLYRPASRDAVRALGGDTGLVPLLIDRGTKIWDTMAIFEHLYEWDPVIWPMDRRDRARARSLCGEMHSGFQALRNAMPVNTRARDRKVARTAEVDADIARIVAIWSAAKGDWLIGDLCAADIMFAPVATRFQTYGVHLDGAAQSYCERLLAHPLVAEWLTLGRAETDVIAGSEVG
jgi:glutathione S-transferase